MNNKVKWAQYSLLGVVWTSFLHTAFAENLPINSQQTKQLDEVEVVGHKADPKNEKFYGAHSNEYLDDTDIDRNRGVSVGDFLRGIPGVLVGDVRNSGGINVNIRGMQGENRVPVVIDGSLSAVPVFRGYYGSSTRTYVDPDLIISTNIEKGPTMTADAVGATGGLVQMKTISAKDIIHEGKDWGVRITGGMMNNTVSLPRAYTRGGYQTEFISECVDVPAGANCQETAYAPDSRFRGGRFANFNSFNGSIAAAKRWQNFDVMLAYARKKQGNYFVGKHGITPSVAGIDYDDDYLFNGSEIKVGKVKFKDRKGFTLYRAGEEVMNTHQDNHSLLVKGGWHLDDVHAAEIGYRRYRSEFGEIMPSILGFRGAGAMQGGGSEVKVDAYTANYRYRPHHPLIDLKANVWRTTTDNETYTPLFEDYGYVDSRYAVLFMSRQYGAGIENRSVFEVSARPLSLNYGLSFSREALAPPSDAQQRVDKKGYPKNAIAPLYVRDGARREWSGFLSGNYSFNRYLSLDGGLRYTHTVNEDFKPYQRYEYILNSNGDYEYTMVEEKYTKPIKTSGFSPIIALTFSPSENWQLYAKYASALRAPSLFQSARGFSNSDTRPNAVPLKAERAKNWEFGVNFAQGNVFKPNDNLLAKLTYFNNKSDNYLTRTRTKVSKYEWVDQTTNIDSVQFKGFELALKYDSGKYYGQLAGTYYTDSKFCIYPDQVDINLEDIRGLCSRGGVPSSNIGNHVPPKKNLSLTVGGRFFAQKLDAGMRLNYYDKRLVPTVRSDNSGGLTSEEWRAYTLLDVYADYRVHKNASLRFSIDNLTNRYYLDAVNVGLNPAPGRTFRLGFKMDF